jgi:hypothetical protein
VIIISIYRSPTGNFKHVLHKLENILNLLYRNKNEICGDINITYLVTSHRKQQLDTLLSTYNLINSVQFPIQILNASSTSIDNIFIDKSKWYTLYPIVNGLSDHDAQETRLNITVSPNQNCTTRQYRNFNKYSIDEF